MPTTKNKTKTKNFIKKGRGGGGGEFINIVEEYPGYYSVNKLHKKNRVSNAETMLEEDELLKPIISQLLTSGDYHVPSYLTLHNRDKYEYEEDTTTDEDEERVPIQKENIIITITPVEKCNDRVIEEELYNALVESAEGLEPKKIVKHHPHPKKRITKRNKKKGGKKTKKV